MRKWILYAAALGLVGTMTVTAAAENIGKSDDESVMEMAVIAENTVAEGTCGDNLTWVLDDTGRLTIEGIGNMNNYGSGAPWNNYLTSIKTVVIGDEVDTIGHYAFRGCTNLTEVTIGKIVNNIGENAFYGCSSLTTIHWGEGLTNISNYAFYDCNALSEVTIPDTVTTIQRSAFYSCDALTQVKLGRGVTTVDQNAFTACPKLTKLTLSDALKTVYSDDNTYIGSFIESPITTIYVPATVTSIPENLYNYGTIANFVCESTKENAGTTNISGDGYFDDNGVLYQYNADSNEQTLVKYPSSMTVPADGYTVLDGTNYIGNKAFYKNVTLGKIVIPDSVTSIGEHAFHDCTSLTDVTLSAALKTIGYSAFEGCKKLPSITFGEKVTTIDGYAFCNCDILKTIQIPDSVITIENDAFANCDQLTTVVLGRRVTTLGKSAFAACPKLTTLTVSDALTNVSAEGTYGSFTNSPLTTVYVPATVTNIPSTLYRYSTIAKFVCEATETSVKVSTNVGGNCYFDDGGVLYLYHVSSGKQTLVKCPRLVTLTAFTYTVLSGTDTIAEYAFEYTSTIKRVHIPASVTTIEKYAWLGCSYLTAAYFYGDTPESFGTGVFERVHENFKIYYVNGKSGWTNPWNGYTTETFTPTTPEPDPAPDTPIKGDANGDGKVDGDDLTIMQKYFSGYPVEIGDTAALDCNGDNKFTRADVMYLARALAKWEGYTITGLQ